MKFKINVKEFIRGLEPAVNIATKNVNSEFETSYHIILHAKNDHILTMAHGGFAAIISPISTENVSSKELKYECISEGKVIVNAIKLIGTLKAFLYEQEVIVDDSTGQLMVSLSNVKEDDEQYQTIPLVNIEEKPIPVADTYEKSITVNKEIFVDGLKRVEFAVGFEESKPYFECIMFIATPNKLRFASGIGARFAVRDAEGIFEEIKGTTQILFPKNNISNIINVLDNAPVQNITIKESINKENTPDQIVIRFGENTLLLLGLDTSIKYYDMDKILKYNYPNKISTELSDWNYIMGGINATFDEDMKRENEVHNTNVSINSKIGKLLVETSSIMKAKRKIDIKEIVINEDNNPYFRCNTVYLSEMANKEGKKGTIYVNFKDQTKADKEDEKIPPILVEYPEIINDAKSIKEKFYMFFSISKR